MQSARHVAALAGRLHARTRTYDPQQRREQGNAWAQHTQHTAVRRPGQRALERGRPRRQKDMLPYTLASAGGRRRVEPS
eukprot:4709632-Pleurochrysis_carterae.AAC.2